MMHKSCSFALIATLLAACGAPPAADKAETVRPLASTYMLAQVRAAGKLGNELDVQPLRDPQVEDLRTLATLAEQRGDFVAAERSLALALRLLPNDPDLSQWQAELALVQRRWGDAETLAQRSFEHGPKLGGLCRRNWTTLQFARQSRGDAVGAGQARQRIAGCTVAPPVRM